MTAGANKLGFTRYYNMLPNSFTGVSGLPTILAATLGPNWRNSYDRYLQLVSTNNQLTAIVAEREPAIAELRLERQPMGQRQRCRCHADAIGREFRAGR